MNYIKLSQVGRPGLEVAVGLRIGRPVGRWVGGRSRTLSDCRRKGLLLHKAPRSRAHTPRHTIWLPVSTTYHLDSFICILSLPPSLTPLQVIWTATKKSVQLYCVLAFNYICNTYDYISSFS